MQHSDFGVPTERTGTGVARALDSDGIAMQVMAALDRGDHNAAGLLLKDAEARFPDDNQIRRLAVKHRRQAERFARVYSLLKEMGELLDQDFFVQALGAFREAANLSHGFAVLEEASFSAAVEHLEQLESKNWRIGIALLEDVERLNAKLVVPAHLWQELRAAERAEIISYALAETGLAKPADLQQARERIAQTLERYPDDNGLINRLRSIDSTIEEKRKSDERQKCLKKLTDLRDELQGVEEPAQAGKFVRLSETLAMPYAADPEFSSVVEDITQQVISGEKAASALAQDRVDDCLEECAWVLSRMRHHRLFLKLKEKAEQRELALVDEYSNSASRIKELLSAGQLAEAEKICSQARTRLPQFSDLQELAQEIAQRKAEQAKEIQESTDSAKRLVERGERSLHEQQFRAAEQAFGNALKLRPEDSSLAGQVLGIMHGYAREIAPENAEAAGEALQITERILPGRPVPPDLTEATSKKRLQVAAEKTYWSALNRISVIDAQVALAKTRPQIAALREQAERGKFTASNREEIKEAANALLGKIESKTAAIDQRQRQLAVFKTLSVAATLLLVAGLAFWFKAGLLSMVRPKPPAVQVVSLAKRVPGVNLAPKPGSVEVHGGDLLTQITLDGVSVASVGKNQILIQELRPGSHVIELSSDGYVPKTIVGQVSPGEKLILTARDLGLQPSNAQQGPRDLANTASWAKVQGLVAKDSKGSGAPVLLAKVVQPPVEGATLQAPVENDLPKPPAPAQPNEVPEAALLAGDGGNTLAELERKSPAIETRSIEEANMRLSQSAKSETAAVLTVITRFATAWTTRDLKSILSIQKNLDRRAVKAELSQVKELNMRISPASAPQIEGSQAVVLCRRQASQVFSDGTRKQNPEAIVSYLLAKHDGAWTIEGTR